MIILTLGIISDLGTQAKRGGLELLKPGAILDFRGSRIPQGPFVQLPRDSESPGDWLLYSRGLGGVDTRGSGDFATVTAVMRPGRSGLQGGVRFHLGKFRHDSLNKYPS